MRNALLLASLLALILFSLPGCGQAQENSSITPDPIKPSQEGNASLPLEGKSELDRPKSIPTDKKPASNQATTPSQPTLVSSDWYLRPNLDHTIPSVSQNTENIIKENQAFYVVSGTDNTVYLTFDEGYELGYTGQILDILKENQVPAMFFITGHYLKTQPELVKRMKEEGHLVGNHTWGHPDLSISSPEEISDQVLSLQKQFEQTTGFTMDKYLRPPQGKYSPQTLKIAKELGYSTVFWSLAFNDWDPDNQPGTDFSHQYVLDHIHPGAVILLHAVSESNSLALDQIIKDLKAQGYNFGLFK